MKAQDLVLGDGEKRAKVRTGAAAPIYLSPEQAAEYLHVTTGMLTKWRCSRKGPVFRKHGRFVVYVQAELDAWSEAQCVEMVNEETTSK